VVLVPASVSYLRQAVMVGRRRLVVEEVRGRRRVEERRIGARREDMLMDDGSPRGID